MSSQLFSYGRAFEVYDWRSCCIDFGMSGVVGFVAVALLGVAEDPGEVTSKFLDMGLRVLPTLLAAEVVSYGLTLLLIGQMAFRGKGRKWATTMELVNSDFAMCFLIILFSLSVFAMMSFLHSLIPCVDIGLLALLLSFCLKRMYGLVQNIFMLGQLIAHY